MIDSHKDYTSIDDRLLSPQQAVKLYYLAPEEARHRLMNTIYRADEALHDQVYALTAKATDAADAAPARGRAGASTRPASLGD